MDIIKACEAIRTWNALFASDVALTSTPPSLPDAVEVLRSFLEERRSDGTPVNELRIDRTLLMTKHGVRYVIPFVLAAETILSRG